MKRLGVAFFFDKNGIVDEYMRYLLRETKPFVERLVFVSNGPILAEAKAEITRIGCEVVIRDNTGYDVAAYKAAIEFVGYQELAKYDELLLFNHTFFGPIFPYEEMFEEMDRRVCDFWGITSHKEMIPNPFTNHGVLPRHINSHFIAIRKKMLAADAFVSYWRNMPEIKSYTDSILIHESQFTQHFEEKGFISSVYIDDVNYDSHYPCFINVEQTIANRCPILKRRPFFHDYLFHEELAIDLPRALRLISEKTNYDPALIWKNILRSADLRTLNTNAALMSIFPDVRTKQTDAGPWVGNIAVCMHVYYVDMVEDLLLLCENIPVDFDVIATTDTEAKAKEIRKRLSKSSRIKNVIVRILEFNRGRDMSALFIACRDLFLDDRYDLVCRLHTKKSPQVEVSRSLLFKRHMEENLLNSVGYVSNVLDMFADSPWIGLAVPPIVHISYPTMGHSWFTNLSRAKETAKILKIDVKFDVDTPVAAYGTMFWFRPKALRKLFAHPWKWEDFNKEPHHVDGGLAHVLERLIAYVAQDAGYTTQHISCAHLAEQNYVSLEYKLQKILSCFPGGFRFQYLLAQDLIKQWAEAGYPRTDGSIALITAASAWKAGWWHSKGPEVTVAESANSMETSLSTETTWRQYYLDRIALDRQHARKKFNLGNLFKAKEYSDRQYHADIIFRFMRETRIVPFNFESEDEQFVQVSKYVEYGWAISDEVLPLFSSNYYLNANRDVAEAGMNPLAHFILHGADEKRNPHPLFDLEYYLKQDEGAAASSENPLLHFLRVGGAQGYSPHPLFDSAYYLERNPDVQKANINPLVHYILYGAYEGRNPHPLFDTEFYFKSNPELVEGSTNALIHFVTTGCRNGRDPHPLFDGRYYSETYNNVPTDRLGAICDFLSIGGLLGRNPHPLFDSKRYLDLYEAVGAMGINPLVHYLRWGAADLLSPHELFDTKFYVERYPEVVAAGVNPLVHFVRWGIAEGRDPNPHFETLVYQTRHSRLLKHGEFPFLHYFRQLRAEHRSSP